VEQYEINWKDYYKIIGISPDAEIEVINAAHKALRKKYHPDTGAADLQRIYEINEAYEYLCNPEKKAAYDRHYRQRQTKTKEASPPKSSYANPPEPRIIPPYVNVGSLKVTEKRTLVLSARNLGGPATDVAVGYSPDVPWLNISTDAKTLPLDIVLEVDTSSLIPNHSYQVQISLIADGVVATAILQFQTEPVSAQQEATCTNAGGTGTWKATTKGATQLNKILPWPSWGWQRAALFAAIPLGIYILILGIGSESILAAVGGCSLMAMTIYGGVKTRWLRDTCQSSAVAKGTAGTAIVLTTGGSLVTLATAALAVAAAIAGIVLMFFLFSTFLSNN